MIFSSYPLAARLHCAVPKLFVSSVNVSPPPEGFHPNPASARRHLPGCFERSKYILSKASILDEYADNWWIERVSQTWGQVSGAGRKTMVGVSRWRREVGVGGRMIEDGFQRQ